MYDFIILNGNKKIMFSAPHSVEQTRDGKIKFSEPETGEIAKELNLLGFPCIIKTKNNNDDANFDEFSLYRNELISYIKENKIIALIDLHEMASYREQNICLGTGGEECLNLLGDHIKEQKLQEYFSSYFKNVTINKPFGAKYPFTVSRYISQNCNIPCVQVEINCKLFVNKLTTLKEIAKIFEGATNILVEKPNEKDIVSK